MANFIEIKDLGITYRAKNGLIHAIDRVDLDAREGEFVTIVGPSGCGKTTLLKGLAGLLPPTTGFIKISGEAVKGTNSNVGIVFQNPVLMAWRTILGNIMLQVEIRHLNPKIYRKRAEELLTLTGLAGFASKYPYQLSGGMQQRASICRALIHDPPILLMDEPFGALDALTREQMAIELQRIWLEKAKTVFFITHSIQEAVFLGDKIVVLSPRPAQILEIITPRLPRPREISTMVDPSFSAAVDHIRRLLSAEAGME
jgi:NitT/TauT family transport system ATP-binding protein